MSDLVVLDFRASAFDFVTEECARDLKKSCESKTIIWRDGIPLLDV